MKKIITIVFILAFLPLNSYPQWTQITSPTSDNLYTVFFTDANTGYVSGSLNGTIYKTTDGGANWIFISTGTASTFYDMYFTNQQTGIIGGTSKQILKTTNAGVNWDIKTSGSGTIYSLAYYPNTYYAVGGNPTVIDKSNDGGNNWVSVTPPTSNPLNGVWFPITPNHGWICGDNGAIWKTLNAGSNWTNQSQGSYNYNSIFFLGLYSGYVVSSEGILLRTTNSGSNWYSLTLGITSKLNDIFILDQQTGWAVGDSGIVLKIKQPEPDMFIVFRQTTSTFNSLNAMSIINSLTGFVVGDNGIILKTTNGGGLPVNVKSYSNEIPEEYELSQNYPNPFNPTTIIKYLLPKSSFVTLTVYDNIGNEIVKLVNTSQRAGYYEVDFNGENLSSGIYYYKITTDDFTTSRKMVLIK